jgi:hypothetical protein
MIYEEYKKINSRFKDENLTLIENSTRLKDKTQKQLIV